MDELISKRAVIEAIEKARANVGHNLERSIGKSIIEILDDVGRDVDRLPSAQPMRGKWICTGSPDESWGMMYECSICGNHDYGGNYCSYCGAKMEDENERPD